MLIDLVPKSVCYKLIIFILIWIINFCSSFAFLFSFVNIFILFFYQLGHEKGWFRLANRQWSFMCYNPSPSSYFSKGNAFWMWCSYSSNIFLVIVLSGFKNANIIKFPPFPIGSLLLLCRNFFLKVYSQDNQNFVPCLQEKQTTRLILFWSGHCFIQNLLSSGQGGSIN